MLMQRMINIMITVIIQFMLVLLINSNGIYHNLFAVEQPGSEDMHFCPCGAQKYPNLSKRCTFKLIIYTRKYIKV